MVQPAFEHDESKPGKRLLFVVVIVLFILAGLVVYAIFSDDFSQLQGKTNSGTQTQQDVK